MSTQRTHFEKIAHTLALTATGAQTKKADLKDLLNSPYTPYVVGGVGGAGLGALLGAMQPKRKGRNALHYGALGGIGGLGLAHLWQQAQSGLKASPAPTPKADSAPPAKPEAPKPPPAGANVVTTPETATLDNLQPNPRLKDEELRVTAPARYAPADVRAKAKSLPDIGVNNAAARPGGWVLSDNDLYKQWRIDPYRLTLPQRLMFGKQLEERAAREKYLQMQLPKTQVAAPPREDGTEVTYQDLKVPDEVDRDHEPYKAFQIKDKDGSPTGQYNPATLSLIREARRAGYGNTPEQIREYQEARKKYPAWLLSLARSGIVDDAAPDRGTPLLDGVRSFYNDGDKPLGGQ